MLKSPTTTGKETPLCFAGARRSRRVKRLLKPSILVFVISAALTGGGCFEAEQGDEFYGRVKVPRAQEFRWSDGGMPRIFDPARAEAPPDTDVVRAMFEGLTDYDSRTLEPLAAGAERWESEEDGRIWTFHLRRAARWSNGDAVTAHDFVRSWRRSIQLGDDAPHANLLNIIEGTESSTVLSMNIARGEVKRAEPGGDLAARDEGAANPEASPEETAAATPTPAPVPFGAEAVDDFTLRVRLRHPDGNFHALVAHPVFRPVHELGAHADEETDVSDGASSEGSSGVSSLITNGAFRLAERRPDGVLLERRAEYWDASAVALERVRVVAKRDAEDALAAYRAGDLDAVTNAAFEPLALKLLAPYKDFRRQTFGALTYYVFNTTRPPFNDRRIREAFALALDIERLSQDTMGGATVPAGRFNPLEAVREREGEKSADGSEVKPLTQDLARARRLLSEAGFPGGTNFPKIRLLVNRNEQQRLLANAIKAMWASTLGVETEIVVRGWDEYEAMLREGDYDIARRSVVMQTTGEESLMLAMFGRARQSADFFEGQPETPSESPTATPVSTPETSGQPTSRLQPSGPALITTETQALRELPAIPIYFPSAFSLVKPYVQGFDANPLDVPSLKRVRIDTNWSPPAREEQVIAAGGG